MLCSGGVNCPYPLGTHFGILCEIVGPSLRTRMLLTMSRRNDSVSIANVWLRKYEGMNDLTLALFIDNVLLTYYGLFRAYVCAER